ncbi:MAG: hypothetical protein KDK56_07205 [Simkania sp.]|nr:hypothetical protein [Simkania sp.]MCP5489737.1 hypothetical protein [Chlamydiales bacterium]
MKEASNGYRTHSFNADVADTFARSHLLTRYAGSYLPSFLTGNVAGTASAVFDEMPTEPTQTFTGQASNVEQMDTGFSEEATVGGTFAQTAQTVATIATVAWNYLPYVATAAAVACLGYKVYRSLSRPTVEVVNNNNITINIKNELPETIEIHPIVKEVKTEKGKEVQIDLSVTPLTRKVALINQAAPAA